MTAGQRDPWGGNPSRLSWVALSVLAAPLPILLILGLVVPYVAHAVEPLVGTTWLVTLVVLAGLLQNNARRDPAGYLSAAVPTGGLAVASLLLYLLGAGFVVWLVCFAAATVLCTLFFIDGRFWSWWSRTVLRRPSPSPASVFDSTLRRYMTAAGRGLTGALRQPMGHRTLPLAQAATALDQMRKVPAPDAEWGALRDELCAAFEGLADCARRGDHGRKWDAAMARNEAAGAQLAALRMRDGLA